MAKLDWHGMLAAGDLLNIAGPSTRTGHEPHNSNTKRFVLYTYRCPPFPGFFIHATAAAGALSALIQTLRYGR